MKSGTEQQTILVANPTQLGDALSAFPVGAILRRHFPASKLYFCSSLYTKPLIEACEYFDGFVGLESVLEDPGVLRSLGIDVLLNLQSDKAIGRAAYDAGIPVRITNLRRRGSARYSNRFTLYSRSNSKKHSVALNLRMLSALGIAQDSPAREWPDLFGLSRVQPLAQEFARLIDLHRCNLVLHPRSGGHGREWPSRHFSSLIKILPVERFKIFVTGTQEEHQSLRQEAPELIDHPQITNLMGQLSLSQFLSFLNAADGLVASGTGPLHIAAALGLNTLGVFPPRRNMDALKWGPIGHRATALSMKTGCSYSSWQCREQADGPACACMASIGPEIVAKSLLNWQKLVQSDRYPRRSAGAALKGDPDLAVPGLFQPIGA